MKEHQESLVTLVPLASFPFGVQPLQGDLLGIHHFHQVYLTRKTLLHSQLVGL
mgnify:CR=1 FL=1